MQPGCEAYAMAGRRFVAAVSKDMDHLGLHGAIMSYRFFLDPPSRLLRFPSCGPGELCRGRWLCDGGGGNDTHLKPKD
jgi:hypothetical protein